VSPAPGVRRATPADLDALTALWIGITRHHEPLDPLYRLRPGAEAAVRELLRACLRDPDAAWFVGELDGEVVGMSAVRIDRAPPILLETERAEITDLGVLPDRRRRGLGRALAEAALAWVRERGVARVEARVVRGNREGCAFWRALGFAQRVEVLERRV
jgi:GNAT superfamily N-acetyltransferase